MRQVRMRKPGNLAGPVERRKLVKPEPHLNHGHVVAMRSFVPDVPGLLMIRDVRADLGTEEPDNAIGGDAGRVASPRIGDHGVGTCARDSSVR